MLKGKDDYGLPQLDAMRLGADYKFKVQLRDFVAFLRPLTMAETTYVVSLVASSLSKVPADQRTSLYENWVLAKETLKIASTSGEGIEDPQLGEILLSKMTADEIQAIWKQYQKGLKTCDPDLEELDVDTIKELVERLKKNPTATTEFTFSQLEAVCRYLLQGV